MLRPRIIPCLLLHNGGLVKTVRFKDPKYVGDPLNAVRIFNEKEVDELIVLDIGASASGTAPDEALIARMAAECRMPLCYGGGVKTVEQIERLISLGVEKVALGSAAVEDPTLVSRAADHVGTQSVVVVLDVKKSGFLGKPELVILNATRKTGIEPISFAEKMEKMGAGEIVFNSVDLDGTMSGYDIPFAKKLREKLKVPLTVLGGAGSLDDLGLLTRSVAVTGAAAGSLFVFKGKYRAVLIDYPDRNVRDSLASLNTEGGLNACG